MQVAKLIRCASLGEQERRTSAPRQRGPLLWAAVKGQDEARAVPHITALEISIPIGGQVRPHPEGDRYLGFLFARAQSADQVEDALRTAHALLEVEIART